MKWNYFGTSLSSAGHYFFIFNDDGTRLHSNPFSFKDFPFNPEKYPEKTATEGRRKGEVSFYYIGGYDIVAIEGSCIDTRWGTKSVFFKQSAEQTNWIRLVEQLKNIQIVMEIVNKMPFPVDFFKSTENPLPLTNLKSIPLPHENEEGLHQRYVVKKLKRKPEEAISHEKSIAAIHGGDPAKVKEYMLVDADPEAEYFIMRLDEGGKDPNHIKACRLAIHTYARAIQNHLPELAYDLRTRYPLI